ncbi:MAG: DUF3179 domain-containing protein [Chlorobi bacterium]|nr:DUF3179 domain-containing protein [Chlorobiota bacterium]
MKYISKISAILLLVVLLIGCEDSVNTTTKFSSDWLVPQDEVFDGGPGRDGIPALSNPNFVGNSSINFMKNNDLIIGVKLDGEIRGYPHPILDWHEIINDQINDNYFSVTYCPLTGSAINYNRDLNGNITTFGVSGLLYNTNLIPYDRATNSNWSQMKLLCVNGKLIGKTPEIFNSIETNWSTWQKIFPDAKVVSSNTGYDRNYSNYPYGNYKSDNNLLFPVSGSNNKFPKKERVHGIILENRTIAFRFNSFSSGISSITQKIDGKGIIIVGSAPDKFIVSYYTNLPNGNNISLTAVQNKLPIILTDNEGNYWDIFGQAVEGPRLGQRLKQTKSFIAYWFAWVAFYPNIEVIE